MEHDSLLTLRQKHATWRLLCADNALLLKILSSNQELADFTSNLLYTQHYIDVPMLQARIRKALQNKPQITLQEICQLHPLEKGLSELVAYMNLACQDNANALVDNQKEVDIHWLNESGDGKSVKIPSIIFTRSTRNRCK